jgi:voltage-gated potassium channel
MTFRKRIYLILEPSEKGGIMEKVFEFILILIIILNILSILLESIDSFRETYPTIFYDFEVFSVIFFTVEYLLRIYSIVEHPNYRDPVRGRIAYATSIIAIVDLLAFLPFYLRFISVDLRFLRIVRLMGLFRMFKITRYMHAVNLMKRVIYDRKEQLVLCFVLILFILVIISSMMFYIEHPYQPEKFSSIPATMWWGVATLTTVGYGDMIPLTAIGKLLSGIFAIVGFGLLALPAGILSAGFFELTQKPKSKKHNCPHCGKDFDEINN